MAMSGFCCLQRSDSCALHAQMLTAKRFVSLGLRHVDDLMPGDAETALGGRVAAYRSARGFAASPPAAHACHGRAAWTRMPDSQARSRAWWDLMHLA